VIQPASRSVGDGSTPRVVIDVQNLHKAFGDRVVLDGVSLRLHEAENLVVLGRSGTGKSVLLRLIVGLLHPDEGDVRVFGEQVATLPPRSLDDLRRRVGFAFQNSALYDSMTVGDNIAYPYRINRPEAPADELEDRVEAMLSAVGLQHARHQMPAELSGGQRKRVGIARALVMEPEILLYDEPTAGLDPITSAEINDLVLEVRREFRTAAIVITHDLVCAKTVGDRIAMLADGRVLVEGSFDDVLHSSESQARSFRRYNFIENGELSA